ncbi:MAG: hypothetical protein V4757_06760 [Pseudomonadota bacterium]
MKLGPNPHLAAVATANWRKPELRAKRSAAMSKGAKARWSDPLKRADVLAKREAAKSRLRQERIAQAEVEFRRLGIPLSELSAAGSLASRSAAHKLYSASEDRFHELAHKLGVTHLYRSHARTVVGWALRQGMFPSTYDPERGGRRWYWHRRSGT